MHLVSYISVIFQLANSLREWGVRLYNKYQKVNNLSKSKKQKSQIGNLFAEHLEERMQTVRDLRHIRAGSSLRQVSSRENPQSTNKGRDWSVGERGRIQMRR